MQGLAGACEDLGVAERRGINGDQAGSGGRGRQRGGRRRAVPERPVVGPTMRLVQAAASPAGFTIQPLIWLELAQARRCQHDVRHECNAPAPASGRRERRLQPGGGGSVLPTSSSAGAHRSQLRREAPRSSPHPASIAQQCRGGCSGTAPRVGMRSKRARRAAASSHTRGACRPGCRLCCALIVACTLPGRWQRRAQAPGR